eukprot:TRINITY_DN1744_c0_g1_i2.p4 TRINITY_DN1744_c0_g1~~TRINITY_DN1744_c0_g1_i2.p4  ORF type:complete len:200 (-),score=65.32 TRINITY_DN1744_c0_g1_i2:833-1381(-)
MPVTPRYAWSETEEEARVTVYVKAAAASSQLSYFCGGCVLKLNCRPYFLQLDLHDYVCYVAPPAAGRPSSSVAVLSDCVVFTLRKLKRGVWGSLTAQLPPEELAERRSRSLEEKRMLDQADSKREEERKWDAQRLAVKQQIEKDTQEREAIRKAKQKDVEAALVRFRQVHNGRTQTLFAFRL